MSKETIKQITQTLPNIPSTLCVNKEDFMKDDFNVEHFVVECRRKVPLEALRNDLHVYMKILQNAMIELINKDYADFVNLSTNLVGMDKSINNLLNPLGHLKNEVVSVRDSMNEAIQAIEEKMSQKERVKEKQERLQTLMSILQSIEKMEKLLGIHGSAISHTEQPTYTSDLNSQLVERVASEFNKLQFYVSKCKSLPLVDVVKPNIATITMTLQYSLEGSFKESLAQHNTSLLRQCLRTYASIDKTKDVEALYRSCIVKPYMEEIINEQFLQNHPDKLSGMYSSILDFFPRHYKPIREIISGPLHSNIVTGYDFVVNAIWPEIVSNIEAKTPSIFAPGNPDVFHEKYTISMTFVEQFERHCSSQSHVRRLRSHPSYNTFMSKWSLPVYFQIRFQEIAGALEGSLFTQFTITDGGSEFELQCSHQLWQCLQRCWTNDVFLAPLCHRFWKLTLQLLSRYTNWTAEVNEQLSKSAAKREQGSSVGMKHSASDAALSSHVAGGGVGLAAISTVATSATLSAMDTPEQYKIQLSNVVAVIHDIQLITEQIPSFFESSVKTQLKTIDFQNTTLLQDNLAESIDLMKSSVSQLSQYVTSELMSQCTCHLKMVNDIPRLYRRTNRETPTRPSSYLSTMIKPLQNFLEEHRHLISAGDGQQWATTVLTGVAEQYLAVTGDVLTSVKKMEESLKRLKAARGTNMAGAGQGVSDDDKIRIQLNIDVKEFQHQVELLGVRLSDNEVFSKLSDTVTNITTST